MECVKQGEEEENCLTRCFLVPIEGDKVFPLFLARDLNLCLIA